MDPTGIFPLEVLQRIFLLLSPCQDMQAAMLVSHRWNMIVCDVLKLRISSSLEAFEIRSCLRWCQAKLLTDSTSFHRLDMPSKRFGTTLILKDFKIFVFGGATSELTAFNDLWIYDLSSSKWQRITKKGDVPSPRAYAKGGIIGQTLYIYGGCHIYRCGFDQGARVDWLNDLYAFCTESEVWKRVSLHHSGSAQPQSPPIVSGQSGDFLGCCHLSEASTFPTSLLMFGGFSRSEQTCTNSCILVLPSLLQWLELPLSPTSPQPLGRWGHASCALDERRLLVVGGNLAPPSLLQQQQQQQATTRPAPAQASDHLEEGQDSPTLTSPLLDGSPAGDVWLLTRYQIRPNQTFEEVKWFWSRVECSMAGLDCPPLDFYHAVAVNLPIFSERAPAQRQPTRHSQGVPVLSPEHRSDGRAFCVALISAASQDWQKAVTLTRPRHPSKRLLSDSTTFLAPASRRTSATFMARQSNAPDSICSLRNMPHEECIESQSGDVITVPEARLGQRLRMARCMASSDCAPKPLIAYTLRLRLPDCPAEHRRTVAASWMGPRRPGIREISSAPLECLGFSCVYGFGALFLFGGILNREADPKEGCESWEEESGASSDTSNEMTFEPANRRKLPSPHQSESASDTDASAQRIFTSPYLYALQPTSLVSTFPSIS